MAERQNRDEDRLQIGVVELLLYNGYWPVHVANQGKRSPWLAATLKKMGLWPGFPDLIVFNKAPLKAPRAGERDAPSPQIVCTIELKRPPKKLKSGGFAAPPKPHPDQIITHAMLVERGIPNLVACSIDDVIAGMARLNAPLRARVMG